MNRRYYLGLLASGLVGGGNAQQETDSRPAARHCATATATATSTSTRSVNETGSTSTPAADGLEIASTRYEEIDGGFLTDAGVWVDVANAGTVHWSYVEVSAAFRDGEGTIVADGLSTIAHLPGCATWRTYVSNVEPGATESATVEITGSMRGEPLATADEAGLTVQAVRMVDPGPTVVGRVTNATSETIEYPEAVVRFRDDEYVYDVTTDTVRNLAAGDSWRFEAEFVTLAPDPPTITDYDLRFATPFDVRGR